MVKITKEAALSYHETGRPGKIEVKPTKPYHTQTDLSLAYSPGVAFPCLEIQQNPDDAYKYTDKGLFSLLWHTVFIAEFHKLFTFMAKAFLEMLLSRL